MAGLPPLVILVSARDDDRPRPAVLGLEAQLGAGDPGDRDAAEAVPAPVTLRSVGLGRVRLRGRLRCQGRRGRGCRRGCRRLRRGGRLGRRLSDADASDDGSDDADALGSVEPDGAGDAAKTTTTGRIPMARHATMAPMRSRSRWRRRFSCSVTDGPRAGSICAGTPKTNARALVLNLSLPAWTVLRADDQPVRGRTRISGHGTTRWTGLPWMFTCHVVVSLPPSGVWYLICHQPFSPQTAGAVVGQRDADVDPRVVEARVPVVGGVELTCLPGT